VLPRYTQPEPDVQALMEQVRIAYSGELVHRFRWKWSSVGESDAGLRT